jgi:hypothetical protein
MITSGFSAATIKDPIALCAYALSLVFGLLARNWKSRSELPRDRKLFSLAVVLAIVSTIGGLTLAWLKTKPKIDSTAGGPITVEQESCGDNASNNATIGGGTITNQTNTTNNSTQTNNASGKTVGSCIQH